MNKEVFNKTALMINKINEVATDIQASDTIKPAHFAFMLRNQAIIMALLVNNRGDDNAL